MNENRRDAVVLPPERSSPRAARHFIDAVLHGWGRDGAIDRAALIASELVTSAVQHAGGVIQVALIALDDVIRLEVIEPRRALVPDESPTAPVGLGLPIVEALASSWGTSITDDGWCTWAEVRG